MLQKMKSMQGANFLDVKLIAVFLIQLVDRRIKRLTQVMPIQYSYLVASTYPALPILLMDSGCKI